MIKLEKIRYKIIDFIHSFSIKMGGYWQDKKWIERKWAMKLESYCWWLKWQHTLKYYGEQDWTETQGDKILNFFYGEKHKFLFKILIGN